jgi:hypothetical protein
VHTGNYDRPDLILCQPDEKKGCSACCGLYNFRDTGRELLTEFLCKGQERLSLLNDAPDDEKFESSVEGTVRDLFSYICPFQGFIDKGQPGCLLHPYRPAMSSRQDLREKSLYGSTICNGYFCPAHAILDNEQKKILIEHIDDWYLYSTAIIDPFLYIWILDACTTSGIDFSNKKKLQAVLGKTLGIHARYIASSGGPAFHYSISEYKLNNNSFSLVHTDGDIDGEKREILDTIRSLV